MSVRRPHPEPFHPPVGTSDEAFPGDRRWITLASLIALALAAAAVAAGRL